MNTGNDIAARLKAIGETLERLHAEYMRLAEAYAKQGDVHGVYFAVHRANTADRDAHRANHQAARVREV